jgi:Tol biopolymer transport system component
MILATSPESRYTVAEVAGLSCIGLAMNRTNARTLLLLCLSLTVTSTVFAQFFYFGRNKVQYTEFDWHVLRTDHFDIYYYADMKDLAEKGAFCAEEAFKILEVKFNHTLGNRVPLIFYSSHLHFQQTNTTGGFIPEGIGGFFEFLKGRVVIPADGSVAQFRHVIRHELVHVFMHSKVARVLTDHRKTQDRYPPLWFVEGLAEFWSTQWDAQAEMVMRDAVLNDIAVGLDNMDQIYGSFLMYKEGQNVLAYMASHYGEEKILMLLENFWKETAFSDILKLTIGKNYKEFDEEWLYALKKQYYPLLATNDAPSHASRKLATEGFNAKPVVFEHDSTREVYFVGNRTGYTGIYKKSLNEPDPEAKAECIIQGEQTDELEAFHPMRSRIDVSSSGSLAFVTKSGEQDALHLYDVVTGEMTNTFRFTQLVSLGSVSWSPDGTQLVFSAIDRGGQNDLYLVNTDTRELRRLTNDVYDDRDPAWSPHGDRIAFVSDRTPYGKDGSYNLFQYDLRSGDIAYLTYGRESVSSPAWSRDGSKLAFTCDAGGVHNIWVMNMQNPPVAGHRTMTRLSAFLTSAFDPAWTSSGDIVFSAFEKFSFKLAVLHNIEGILDTATTVMAMDVASHDIPWSPQNLSGEKERERYRYRGDYSLDIAQSAISTDPVFGTAGGAFAALSDILGNEQYYFLIYNTAETQDDFLSSFNIAISRISMSQRTSFAYGIYRFTGRRYDLTAKEEYYYERVFGGYFALSYPLSKFNRVESEVSISNSNREIDGMLEERKALLVSNSLSFTHDNSLWGPSGPLDGSRFNLTLAYTSDVQYSNVNYFSVIADYRHYFRLGQRSAFASRFWLFYNHGKESRRFVMGGSWDLRGYDRWSIRGEKLWLTSHELRFPFVDELAIRFPFFGLSFFAIRGALFFDAGSAWDRDYLETLGSIGGGLRLNLGGVLVLRYDIGKRIEDNFTRLQSGLFYQFFFGFDF